METAASVSSIISVADIARSLFLRRRWIVGAGAVGFLVALAFVVSKPRVYRSNITFTGIDPSGRESRLAGLASQFGLGDLAGVQTGGIVPTPDFVAQLAHSSFILSRVLEHDISVDSIGGRMPLKDLVNPFQNAGSSSRERKDAAIRRFRTAVAIRKNKLTNSTTLGVTIRSPYAARDAVNLLFAELNEVFLQMHRSQAEEERRFSLERISERQRSLEAAEGRLSTFLIANRQYEQSPVLIASYERLQRDVTTQTQILTGLIQSFENASLRAVRDTPLLLVVEPAEVPVDPQSRQLVVTVMLGAIAGAMIAIFGALVYDQRRGAVVLRDGSL